MISVAGCLEALSWSLTNRPGLLVEGFAMFVDVARSAPPSQAARRGLAAAVAFPEDGSDL